MPQHNNPMRAERIYKSEKRRERATQAHTAHCIDWFEHKKDKNRGSDKQKLQQLAADRKSKKEEESSCEEEDLEIEVQVHVALLLKDEDWPGPTPENPFSQTHDETCLYAPNNEIRSQGGRVSLRKFVSGRK